MIRFSIASALTKIAAKVTNIGQLVVAPFAYDEAKFQALNVADTAFSFFPPISNEQFVITGLRIKANRDVSNVTDASIIIYEAENDATTTVDRTLYEDALIRGEFADFVPINILVNKGKFVNAKTSEATIFINLVGYYIPIV